MNDAVTFDVPYTEARNRGTVAIRLILAIPHMIVQGLWSYFIALITVIQWFIVLFTGKRNEGIWNMQNQFLGYVSRVGGYLWLLHDVFPPFGTDAGSVPSTYQFAYTADANRLSNALRYFWAIPAMIVTIFFLIGAEILALISWFAIVITGKMPKGMFDFILKAQRQLLRLQSYTYLMTDTYPNANP
jgi:hypothetical protein